MAILVIAEHDGGVLKAATRNTVTAAAKVGAPIRILVAGSDCGPAAGAASKISGVSKVMVADDLRYGDQTAENVAALVAARFRDFSHILVPAGTFGKNLAPRLAALLDVAPVSDVLRVEGPDTFVRPVYAGNAWVTVRSSDPVKVVTVRAAAFEPAGDADVPAPVEAVAAADDLGLSRRIRRELSLSGRPELTEAEVVVSGGRALGSRENFFRLLEPLADRLGAAIGASRAAVDAGYVSNDYQVGQTGKIVAPRLYIAVGISGAIQHLAGMKDAKVIVAVNKDPDAPIFQVSDYFMVGDLFRILPELIDALEND